MSKKVLQLRKRNNQMEEKLSYENQDILTDIVVYLRTSGISNYQQETIRQDIITMMIDGETRGLDMHDVIGDNYKEFCDNIIQEIPKRSLKERILVLLSDLSLYCWVTILVWFLVGLFNTMTEENTLPFIVLRLGDFIYYALLMFVSIFMIDYIGRDSFDVKTKHVLSRSKKQFIFFMIANILIIVISRTIFKQVFFQIHMMFVIVVLIGLFVIYKILDEKYD